MNAQTILNCSSSTEARQTATAFARANNFNVTAAHNEIHAAWMNAMSEIHSNGKEGNYEAAMLLSVAAETLQTWA